uniref:Uncharacterized protein n=1 Tax=Populus trichocarpa TaxID=3694 RepID=A0A2K1XI87_POPTR
MHLKWTCSIDFLATVIHLWCLSCGSRIYVDILCEIREKDCHVLWQYSLQIFGIFGWREMQEFLRINILLEI